MLEVRESLLILEVPSKVEPQCRHAYFSFD